MWNVHRRFPQVHWIQHRSAQAEAPWCPVDYLRQLLGHTLNAGDLVFNTPADAWTRRIVAKKLKRIEETLWRALLLQGSIEFVVSGIMKRRNWGNYGIMNGYFFGLTHLTHLLMPEFLLIPSCWGVSSFCHFGWSQCHGGPEHESTLSNCKWTWTKSEKRP